MIYDDCSNLDAYLLGDLPADAALRFSVHLELCEACRDAADEQRWIEGLLTSPLGREIESAPDALIATFHSTTFSYRRPIRLIAGIFATAAALAVAAGWSVLNRQASDIAAPDDVAINSAVADVSPSAPRIEIEPPRATFVGGPNVLVVPVASRYPNVTIVRVYHEYQPSYHDQASSEPLDPDQFNGG